CHITNQTTIEQRDRRYKGSAAIASEFKDWHLLDAPVRPRVRGPPRASRLSSDTNSLRERWGEVIVREDLRTPQAPSRAERSLIGDHELAGGDMEPIIAGRDLRKSWGATLVLEHADFLLHEGDKVALVGPNGSGKSTLFRLLAGETAPDLGDLVLKPGLRYGYLPQVPNVPPETAVRDVLSAPSPEAQR